MPGIKNIHSQLADFHLQSAKLHQSLSKIHDEKLSAAKDSLEKSVAEASRDFHSSMSGIHADQCEFHVAACKAVDTEEPKHAAVRGDFAKSNLSETDVDDLLRKLSPPVRVVYPSDAGTLVPRPGASPIESHDTTSAIDSSLMQI